MGEVIQLRRPRPIKSIRGHARQLLTDALSGVGKAKAVVIVVIGDDGAYSIRSASEAGMHPFDLFSRAGVICDRERNGFLE